MFLRYCKIFFIVGFFAAAGVFGEGIIFTFSNGHIDGGNFEFDVVAASTTSDTTRIGDTMVYIYYSTAGFGQNIAGAGKITVTKETLMSGDAGAPTYFPFYTIVNIIDHFSNMVAITNQYNYKDFPSFGNILHQSGDKLIHVSMVIGDEQESSDLSFNEGLMGDQQYKSYNTEATIYDPVTASSTWDQSLPVAMTAVTATVDNKNGVNIIWTTGSELNSAGFHVWRSLSEDQTYNKITSALIPSQGNTSVAQEYSYNDKNVESNVIYWYKIEEISMDGKSKFFGPISVMGMKPVPKDYGLAQNYPNPFNPETKIEFQLPENAEVSIVVYSLLGREIKTLVKEKMEAGYQKVTWYGKDDSGVKVPSGMYIIQMQAGDFQQVRKMTIIR